MTAGGDRVERFASTLRQLKRRGCLLLVTGRASDATVERAGDRFLGASIPERRRLVVLADPDAEDMWSDRLSTTDVVDWRRPPALDGGRRGLGPGPTPITGSGPGPGGDAGAGGGPADLRALRGRIVDVVADCEAESRLDAAEFRVVVDSVDELVDREGTDAVVRFAAAVGAVVRGVHGIAALRVRRDDDRILEALDPIADARIEVRDGTPPVEGAAGGVRLDIDHADHASDVGGIDRPVDGAPEPGADTGAGGDGDAAGSALRYTPQQRIHLPGVGTSDWLPL
jgi:hypothetical protein